MCGPLRWAELEAGAMQKLPATQKLLDTAFLCTWGRGQHVHVCLCQAPMTAGLVFCVPRPPFPSSTSVSQRIPGRTEAFGEPKLLSGRQRWGPPKPTSNTPHGPSRWNLAPLLHLDHCSLLSGKHRICPNRKEVLGPSLFICILGEIQSDHLGYRASTQLRFQTFLWLCFL